MKPKLRTRFVSDVERDKNPRIQAEHYETWDVPAVISPQIISAATDALNDWREFFKPAPRGHIGEADTIADWLSSLGILCAGQKMTVAEAQEKIVAYAPGLAFPQFCFSQKSLYAAGRYFKWFPSFSELCDWLETYAKPARVIGERLAALANAKPMLAAPAKETIRRYEDLTPDERKEHDATMKGLRLRLAEAGVGNSRRAEKVRREMDERDQRMKALLKPLLDAKHEAFMASDTD